MFCYYHIKMYLKELSFINMHINCNAAANLGPEGMMIEEVIEEDITKRLIRSFPFPPSLRAQKIAHENRMRSEAHKLDAFTRLKLKQLKANKIQKTDEIYNDLNKFVEAKNSYILSIKEYKEFEQKYKNIAVDIKHHKKVMLRILKNKTETVREFNEILKDNIFFITKNHDYRPYSNYDYSSDDLTEDFEKKYELMPHSILKNLLKIKKNLSQMLMNYHIRDQREFYQHYNQYIHLEYIHQFSNFNIEHSLSQKRNQILYNKGSIYDCHKRLLEFHYILPTRKFSTNVGQQFVRNQYNIIEQSHKILLNNTEKLMKTLLSIKLLKQILLTEIKKEPYNEEQTNMILSQRILYNENFIKLTTDNFTLIANCKRQSIEINKEYQFILYKLRIKPHHPSLLDSIKKLINDAKRVYDCLGKLVSSSIQNVSYKIQDILLDSKYGIKYTTHVMLP